MMKTIIRKKSKKARHSHPPRVLKKRLGRLSRLSSAKLTSSNGSVRLEGAVGTSRRNMVFEKTRPRIIPVSLGDHQPSPHILTLRRLGQTSPSVPAVQPIDYAIGEPSWRYWTRELSILSVLGFLFLIGVGIARHLFRIPVSATVGHSSEAQAVVFRVTSGRLHLRRFRRSFGEMIALPWTISRKIFTPAARGSAPWNPEAVEAAAIGPRGPTPPFFGSFASATVRSSELTRGFGSQLMYVALVGLVIMLPVRLANEALRLQAVRAEVTNTAAAGLVSFVAGSQAVIDYNFFKASGDFEMAVNRFEEAKNALEAVPAILRTLASALTSGQSLASGERLLRAGAALSRVGQTVSSNFIFLKHDGKMPSGGSAAELLSRLSETAALIRPDLKEAEEALADVRSEDLPPAYRPAFSQVQLLVPVVRSAVEELLALDQLASDLWGFEEPRRYLVMFQNNHELRASGGFMGSFAVIDVVDGRVQSLNIAGGGTYDLQGSLIKRLLAPEPLQLINPRWEFQDANWWSDWPTSARKIAWFYRQAGGESVDGVIAVDLSFIESLLDITGPISMPAYNLTVTSQNFAAEAQAESELRYDRTVNRPKQFIADLAPLLISRLETDLDNNIWLIAGAVSRALTEKHVLVYRERVDIESRLASLGWAGALAALPRFTDTVGIVHTNIAGGKTDGVIRDVAKHVVSSQADGSLVDTLTIERSHEGKKGEVFTGVRNVDYLRVYVPLGSRLLGAEGFMEPDQTLFQVPANDLEMDEDLGAVAREMRRDPTTGVTVYNEFGRTVFAHWLMVDPGESTTVRLRYQLPWRVEETSGYSWQPWSSYFGWTEDTYIYRFLWEKQPGTGSTILRHSFKSEKPLRLKVSSRPVAVNDYGWQWEESLSSDANLVVTFAF